jgi:hypothetical protein
MHRALSLLPRNKKICGVAKLDFFVANLTFFVTAGIQRVAILDFDVHHGNGTQAVVANTQPSTRKVCDDGCICTWWICMQVMDLCAREGFICRRWISMHCYSWIILLGHCYLIIRLLSKKRFVSVMLQTRIHVKGTWFKHHASLLTYITSINIECVLDRSVTLLATVKTQPSTKMVGSL